MNESKRSFWLGILALVVATFVAYSPALNGGFIWDDDDYVWENETLDAPDALAQIWALPESGEDGRQFNSTPQYYPLVFTTFWIESKLWGRGHGDTLGYHIVNVLLHAASASVLWRILRRLKLRGAFVAAAVFALHPAHVESVAWITERKNVLSGLFYLTAMLAYLRFLGPGVLEASAPEPEPEPEPTSKKAKKRALAAAKNAPAAPALNWKFYGVALIAFVGALLSKSVTASLPAAILLILFWKQGRLTSREVLPLVPFFFIGYMAGSHTADVEASMVFKYDVDLGVHGAEHLLVAGRAIWFYAGKLLLPLNLVFMYPRWDLDTASLMQWLFPVSAVLAVALTWWRREQLGRGPLVALLFFGGTLIPALGFVDVFPMYYSYVADHFQYLASLGVIVLVICGAAHALETIGTGKLMRAASVVVVGALAFGTWNQCHDYKDLETLWRQTLEKNPGALMAAINLSNQILNETGDLVEANRILEDAFEVVPPGIHPTIHARAHYNYGNNLARLDRIQPSRESYHRALEIDPTYVNAHYALGHSHEKAKDLPKAIEHYTDYYEACKKRGDHGAARNIQDRIRSLRARANS